MKSSSTKIWIGFVTAVTLAAGWSPVPVAADQSLSGLRLFLSAEQRQKLNDKRSGVEKPVVPIVVEKPKLQPPKPKLKPKPIVLPRVTLQGYVARSDGKPTVWVNNRPLQEGEFAGKKVRVIGLNEESGSASITLPDDSTVTLQPGQRFDPNKKRVVDPVQ